MSFGNVKSYNSGGDLIFAKKSDGTILLTISAANGNVVIPSVAAGSQVLTKVSLATQSPTITAAQIMGGYIAHASTVGAGTVTLPTGANLDLNLTALGVALTVGASFSVVFQNTGTQTDTLTTNTGLTLQGTATVPTLTGARIAFIRTGTGTWDVNIVPTTALSGAVTSASASALTVGPSGATNPTLQVDASTASALTGIKVKSAGTGAGAAISVVETGGTNNALTIDAMGSGVLNLGGTSTGIVILGRGSRSVPVWNVTRTAIGTQNAAPTIAQLLGGQIVHTSTTGAGTFTTPTGAAISAGIPGVAVGDTFECLYMNIGNQTVTVTAGDGAVTFPVGQVVAIPTHRYARLTFVNVSAGVWEVNIALVAAT